LSSAAGCGRSSWYWVWCAASDRERHIAVNNAVRRQISDSGAIRSITVPKVKMSCGSVAFWHKCEGLDAFYSESLSRIDPERGSVRDRKRVKSKIQSPFRFHRNGQDSRPVVRATHIALERGNLQPTTVASTMPPVLSLRH
jgi:hypothetical protein